MIEPGLVSSAAYEIQLTADCELPRFDTRGSWSFWGFFSEEPGVRRSAGQSPPDLEAAPQAVPRAQLVGRSGAG